MVTGTGRSGGGGGGDDDDNGDRGGDGDGGDFNASVNEIGQRRQWRWSRGWQWWF